MNDDDENYVDLDENGKGPYFYQMSMYDSNANLLTGLVPFYFPCYL